MKEFKKSVEIIGGGTVYHVRNHLALCAPAYGSTARLLSDLCKEHSDKLDVRLHLTKMADPLSNTKLETNQDVEGLVDMWIQDPNVKIVFFNVALTDYEGSITEYGIVGYDWGDLPTKSGKYEERLKTSEGEQKMLLSPAPKLLSKIRKQRKDIFLVGFKTTCGATEDEQYLAGLNLLKKSSCNLVLANDTKTRVNMIITPEEARYHTSTDREYVLKNLVEMAYLRSHLSFTRSTVVSGDPVSWNSSEVPESLRAVVDHCIKQGAYKPFNGATVGHFACKLSDTEFLTSRRKTNFNDLSKLGLVRVKTDGPDSVIAYGSKPSVGGISQKIIFRDNPDYDCIVHFHSPIRSKSLVPKVSQREYECGSMECGRNTSNGLKRFGDFSAVYLDEHGPNIVFNSKINPQVIIDFINENFDLSSKTGGPVKL